MSLKQRCRQTVLFLHCRKVANLIVATVMSMFIVEYSNAGAESKYEQLTRCNITAEQNRTGRAVFFNRSEKKSTVVEKTVNKLSRIQFDIGHNFSKPRVSFQNDNKFGISALALGFAPVNSAVNCAKNPKDYEAVFLCRSIVPGLGVAAGEYGSLDCNDAAKEVEGYEFCVIGFTPDFSLADGGLAEAMNRLGMCD